MDEYGRRSSYGKNNNGLQLDFYHGNFNNNNNNNNHNLRSYSLNYGYPETQFHQNRDQFPYDFDHKLKRAKTTSGSSSSSSKVWCFNDPEFKRKKRVASYRALTMDGKVKGTLRRSFKWIKNRFLYGWW